MFVIDAASLTKFQTCRRLYLLSTAYHPRKWRPRSLLSACLRDAIYQVSNGADPVLAAKDARLRFMQTAADAGLDMPPGGDPYRLAKDCCAIIDVIPRCVAKLILLTMQPAPDLELEFDTHWRTLAWADDSSALHRWVFVDRIDPERIESEGHSWYVAGDVMLSRTPMTLHFVELGQIRKGRMRSPWTQAYYLPALRNGDYHFRAKSGAALKGQWETRYLADDTHADVNEWAGRAWTEGAAVTWMQHVNVTVPSEDACAATTQMVRNEARDMRRAVDGQWSREWHQYPMARAACDGPFLPCVFQPACYAPSVVNLSTIPLYVPRGHGTINQQLAPPSATQPEREVSA